MILITAWGSIPLAVEGIRRGAFDFITKPWDRLRFMQQVRTAIAVSAPPAPTPDIDRSGIIGRSKALEEVLDVVRRVAPTDASVLITGENGTGKELIARAIHRSSRRAAGPLVTVNLGGISQSLFESEMFGHVKGAYTGALTDRIGRFEMADGGTIFLDEIGDLDLNCQVKMLRVLQEHTFERLGDSRRRHSDFRTVCATNADLAQMLRSRTFREDLYYRINTITINMPALRERRDDIPLLVRHFASAVQSPPVSSEAMDYLCRLPYPGNVRQLKNLVERCALLSPATGVDRATVELAARGMDESTPAQASPEAGNLDDMERRAVAAALEKHGGNLTLAAAELGITRQSLYRRLEKYGFKR